MNESHLCTVDIQTKSRVVVLDVKTIQASEINGVDLAEYQTKVKPDTKINLENVDLTAFKFVLVC